MLGKTLLDTTEFLISKTLIDSYISQYEFVSVNNMMKDEIKYNDEIFWLNKKHRKEGVDQKKLWKITTKHHSDHRK